MNNIYVPYTDYNCYVVYDKDTIRAFHTAPQLNSYADYTDYFINSHYISRDGRTNFYNTLPVCLDKSNLTTEFYYRNDLSDILIIIFILFFFCFYIPYKFIISKFIKRL